MRTAYIFLTYLNGVVFFGIFRLLLVIVYMMTAEHEVAIDALLLKSFAIGLQFDTCVSCYLLALPLLAVLTGYFAKIENKVYYKIVHIFTCTVFSVAFLISAADIPYFNYFFAHLNATVFSYFSSFGFLVKMIVQEPAYLVFALLFAVVCFLYVLLMNRYYKKVLLQKRKDIRYFKSVPFALLCVLLCCVGMRGRLAAKSPLRVGTAYHCDNAFLNYVGLNPSFTLLKSVEEYNKTANKPLQLVDGKTANEVWKRQMEAERENDRVLKLRKGTNVIVLIMESMSADKVGHFNAESRSTPSLDALIDASLCYERCYTAGIHTYNGLYSTLFAHPALFSRHSMKATMIPQMCGLPNNFAARGYQTFYFTTHDAQFDNIAGFLHANKVQKIISQSDYPSKQIKSTLGVSDHVMYEKAIEIINKRDKGKAFFACLLSSSDHGPYILPTDIAFKPKSKELKQQMVEYADWAIGHFISLARKQDWFENTLFVLVADHGYAKPGSKYEMPLSYHHTPMILYCPAQIPPQKDSCLALQIDITPTVLSMLFEDYGNNTLGVDLQRVVRQYAYFSADDKLGVLDDEYFYINERSGKEKLYRLADIEKRNLIGIHSSKAREMRTYAFSMLQKSSDMLKDGTTSCK